MKQTKYPFFSFAVPILQKGILQLQRHFSLLKEL